ncbi:MAG: A/G-specific adenine glycosylase [Aureispira sp.]|nr:A/G-specific adenine glycosylase [Aureispira sp.]
MDKKAATKQFFRTTLLDWFQQSERPLPWKDTKDPYLIWLSEIILQQTRVEQGMPYYKKFVEKYPSIQDLARAEEDEVLKLWEGLGYYSRARNLHYTAKYIVNDLDGIFPTTHKSIRKLKGVGDYTAAAIASFAYGQPHAVVDGNVYRVLSRFFGIETAIDTTEGKKEFKKLADELLDTDNPAEYNQAIMDFGAIHCKPKRPLCPRCLHREKCVAYKAKQVHELPKKSKKIKKRDRFFYYLIMNYKGKVQIRKRVEKDIWQELYEFPMIEMSHFCEWEEVTEQEWWKKNFKDQQFYISKISKAYKQTLSHQKIVSVFIEIKLIEGFFLEKEVNMVVDRKKIKNFAFPKIITTYLNDKHLYLDL